MARQRCDPIPGGLRAAILSGEVSGRAAYFDYASSVGRPFARSTFSVMLRKAKTVEAEPPTCANVLDRWRVRPAVTPRILALSLGGGLRVQVGALKVFDGPQVLTYT